MQEGRHSIQFGQPRELGDISDRIPKHTHTHGKAFAEDRCNDDRRRATISRQRERVAGYEDFQSAHQRSTKEDLNEHHQFLHGGG
jgi:hypothetical protein